MVFIWNMVNNIKARNGTATIIGESLFVVIILSNYSNRDYRLSGKAVLFQCCQGQRKGRILCWQIQRSCFISGRIKGVLRCQMMGKTGALLLFLVFITHEDGEKGKGGDLV